MKNEEMIVLGLAGLAVFMIMKSQSSPNKANANILATVTRRASEVLNSAGKAFSNGWRYFTDGTAIDPQGNYWYGGQLIWNNPNPTTSA